MLDYISDKLKAVPPKALTLISITLIRELSVNSLDFKKKVKNFFHSFFLDEKKIQRSGRTLAGRTG